MQPPWRAGRRPGLCRERRLWDRFATTFPARMQRTTNRRISRSTCCPPSTNLRGSVCGATRKRGTRRSAAGRSRRSTLIDIPMSELANQTQAYLDNLRREGASAHTVAAYASDIAQFIEYLSPPGLEPPEPRAIDHLLLREWMAWLYGQGLS